MPVGRNIHVIPINVERKVNEDTNDKKKVFFFLRENIQNGREMENDKESERLKTRKCISSYHTVKIKFYALK